MDPDGVLLEIEADTLMFMICIGTTKCILPAAASDVMPTTSFFVNSALLVYSQGALTKWLRILPWRPFLLTS